MKNTIFNEIKLKELCQIVPNENQIEIVNDWSKMIDDKKFVHEVKKYLNFSMKFLQKLLGYNEDFIAFEEKFGSGRVEFSLRKKPKEPKFVAIVELKDQNTGLDELQMRGEKYERSPVDQAFEYASNGEYEVVEWIIVSNYSEFRLYNYHKGKKPFITFSVKDLLEPDVLKIFISLFSKQGLIDEALPTKALRETLFQEREITNELYSVYHITRLEILRQLKDFKFDGRVYSLDECLSMTQTLLNRILFIAFSEDRSLIESGILEETIMVPVKTRDVDVNRTEIWHKLNLLFGDINKGKPSKKIPKYNGNLFKENLEEKIKFFDLIDRASASYAENKVSDEVDRNLGAFKDRINPIFKNILILSEYNYLDEISVDILGHIFEQSILDTENLRTNGIDAILDDYMSKKRPKRGSSDTRKKEGIFYTPEIITTEIARSAIFYHLSKKKTTFTAEKLILEHASDIQELEEKASKLNILDLACGSGAFLSKASEVLIDLLEAIHNFKIENGIIPGVVKGHKNPYAIFQRPTLLKQIIEKHLYGADISENAIGIAKLSLFLQMANTSTELPDLSANFHWGNSVIPRGDESDVKLFNNKSMAFDIIISNPPYIPTEKLTEDEKTYFSDHYTVYRKYDTSIIFLERALDLLEPGGVLGFIIPQSWQNGDNFIQWREVILKRATIIKVINLPFDIFPEAYVDTCIVLVENRKSCPLRDEFLAYEFPKNDKLATLNVDNWERVSMSCVFNHSQKEIYLSVKMYEIWDKIKALMETEKCWPLGDITESTQGYAGNVFIKTTVKIGTDSIPFFEEGFAERHFIIIEKSTFVDMTPHENINRFYTSPKVFIRRIINRRDRLMAFYYEADLLTTKDYNPFILKADWIGRVNYRYLAALLNSKALSYIYIGRSVIALRDDFRATTLTKLRELPIPIPESSIQESIGNLEAELSSLIVTFIQENKAAINTIKCSYPTKLAKDFDKKLKSLIEWDNSMISELFIKLGLDKTEEILKYCNSKKVFFQNLANKIKELESTIDKHVYDLLEMDAMEIDIIERRFNS